MGRIIEVVNADATWGAAFDREAADLARVFGQALVGIHHIGSTSVPALPAKPIIDILVVLSETDTIARFDGAMEALGLPGPRRVFGRRGARYARPVLLQ